jgi:hypothetical protein
MEDWDIALAEYHDILMADWLVTIFYAVVLLVLIGCLYLAIQTFRRRVSWGQARVMGVPFAIFVWIQVLFYLALLDGVYNFAAIVFATPIWLDLSITVLAIAAALFLFWKLHSRPTFKPRLFIALVLMPLGIPGTAMVARLTKVGAVEVSSVAGVALLKYGDNLEGLALKNADEIGHMLPVVRMWPSTMDTVVGKVRFVNSIQKGRLGDHLTALRLTAMRYTKLSSKYNGVNGIDGLFVKRGTDGQITDLLIIENKVDGGRLAPGQMSDGWVLDRVQRLSGAADPEIRTSAAEVHAVLIQRPDAVHKELWQHSLRDGTTTVRQLDANGTPGAVTRSWQDSFIKNHLARLCNRNDLVCEVLAP